MKRQLFILMLFILTCQVTHAQDLWKTRRYEAFVAAGMTQFFGDIGGYTKGDNVAGFKDFSFMQTRFDIQGALKYRLIPSVKLKLGLNFGMLHATDEKGSNEGRNFEATTTFFSPELTCEYSFIKSKMENSYLFSKGRRSSFSDFMSSLDIYAFTGIGGLSFNVKGNDALASSGKMVDSGFTGTIPVGLGANLLMFPDVTFGVEFCGRYTFSDYLDGYTSQYSKSNDVFYTFNITFTYKIPTASNGLPAFLSKRKY